MLGKMNFILVSGKCISINSQKGLDAAIPSILCDQRIMAISVTIQLTAKKAKSTHVSTLPAFWGILRMSSVILG